MGGRRIALCFDGTWNDLDSDTNVSRIASAIGDEAWYCTDQMKFYDPGVGTKWGETIKGGLLGWGLDQNILQGCCWLVKCGRATGVAGTCRAVALVKVPATRIAATAAIAVIGGHQPHCARLS